MVEEKWVKNSDGPNRDRNRGIGGSISDFMMTYIQYSMDSVLLWILTKLTLCLDAILHYSSNFT